ncbi:GntR family transcriptional regulator [Glycomyces algeriensis]|uniref:Transcriptional regulator n=1 Tax=Glycomyces algeriensis TaxID=256037 RepID=A0A9W6G536_9ACTN|nr:GntR family transcriptional regulator [Glycomyces algeriensis]MDA1368923.1 GntR family transcriptional regulator [Glycomyces algeriensis]MDR7352803.1 DNA-binding GntR family transcriptional regulator [Glycomyces algeriensis]GLI40487.1 transcriptional regulator [Glycomyces algeriensis]
MAGDRASGKAPRRSPQEAVRAVRDDIIRGVFAPGERLTEEALAGRYGVSRVPVREALRVLEAEGFVEAKPYVGVFVRELSESEAEDLLELRSVVEPMCAARAAVQRTPEQLGRLKELLNMGWDAVQDGRLGELPRLNSRFHEVIAEASGSEVLGQMIRQISQKIAWVYAVELPRRAEDSWTEHEGIVAAIGAGDADRASALLAEHIAHATHAYRRRERQAERAPEDPAPTAA